MLALPALAPPEDETPPLPADALGVVFSVSPQPSAASKATVSHHLIEPRELASSGLQLQTVPQLGARRARR